MGNVVGRRVPDRSAQQYGGNNPYATATPPVETGEEVGKDANWMPTGTVVEEGQPPRQEEAARGWAGNANNETPSWSDLEPQHKLAAVILGILACLIFIYPPLTLILSSSNCPEEFFLTPYFGFLTGVAVLFCFSAASYAGPLRGVGLALFPLIFFSIPAVFMYFTGFGEGCEFLGVANGFLLFYPVLTGSFLFVACTLGRGLNEVMGDVASPITYFRGNADHGAWGNERVVQVRGRQGWN